MNENKELYMKVSFYFIHSFKIPFSESTIGLQGIQEGKKREGNARNLKIEIECNSFYLYNRGKFFEYGKKEQKTERKTAETQNRCANK